jgi:hypothetical protein
MLELGEGAPVLSSIRFIGGQLTRHFADQGSRHVELTPESKYRTSLITRHKRVYIKDRAQAFRGSGLI